MDLDHGHASRSRCWKSSFGGRCNQGTLTLRKTMKNIATFRINVETVAQFDKEMHMVLVMNDARKVEDYNKGVPSPSMSMRGGTICIALFSRIYR